MTSPTTTGLLAKPSVSPLTSCSSAASSPPSATGSGLVLAVFEGRVGPGQLTVEQSRPLTNDLYREL